MDEKRQSLLVDLLSKEKVNGKEFLGQGFITCFFFDENGNKKYDFNLQRLIALRNGILAPNLASKSKLFDVVTPQLQLEEILREIEQLQALESDKLDLALPILAKLSKGSGHVATLFSVVHSAACALKNAYFGGSKEKGLMEMFVIFDMSETL